MQKILTLLGVLGLLLLLPSYHIKAQDNLKINYLNSTTAPDFLNICGDPDQITMVVSANGADNTPRTNVQAFVHLFKGVKLVSFMPQLSSPGVTAVTTDPANPVFSLPTIGTGSGGAIQVTFTIEADCSYTDTVAANDALEVIDLWEFQYNMGVNTGLSEQDFSNNYRDAMKVPYFTMGINNDLIGTASIGDCFTRTVYVNNSALDGFVDQLNYFNVQGPGVSVQTLKVNGQTVPFTKQATFSGDTIIKATLTATQFMLNTQGLNSPGNGDGFFDPDETMTVTETACLVSCYKSKLSKHNISWGCGLISCDTVFVTDLINSGEGTVNIVFATTGVSLPSQNTGYCKQGISTIRFSNNGFEIDPGTGTMYNISVGIGLGSNFLVENNGFVITSYRIAGVDIPANDSIIFLEDFPAFQSDVDGPGGLMDLDNDGYFDDMTVGGNLEMTAFYEVECSSVNFDGIDENCFNDLGNSFNAKLFYTNFCNERVAFAKSSYFGPSHLNDSYENCTDPDTYNDGSTFYIMHTERRNVFNFEKNCNGEEQMLVKVALSAGITPVIDEFVLSRFTDTFPLISQSISNDTLYLAFDASSTVFLNGDYFLTMAFQADCNAALGLSHFYTEISYFCAPCSCEHLWYCENILGPKIHGATPPCPQDPIAACPAGVRTTSFDVNRTTFGFEDTNFTIPFDPALANTKVAISCDSIEMKIASVVGSTPLSDSIGFAITYSNVDGTDSVAPIFLFDYARINIRHNGILHECLVDSSTMSVDQAGSFRTLRFDLHDCISLLGFALSPGDSVIFCGSFALNPNGPYPALFKKVPNLRGWGFYTDNGMDIVCDDYGDLFRIAKERTTFSFPNNSTFPKGCNLTNLDYRLITINNGFKDFFGNEYREAVAIDSIKFYYDPLILEAFDSIRVEVSIPDHPFWGNNFVPIHTLDSSGYFIARFDTLTKVPSLNKISSYAFNLRLRLMPSCRALTGSKLGSNRFDFDPVIYFKDRYYARHIGDGSCVLTRRDSVDNDIYYTEPPILSQTPVTNPDIQVLGDTVSWTVKLCNTSTKGNAGYTWVALENTDNSIVVYSIEDITNPANIKNLSFESYGTLGYKVFAFSDPLKLALSSSTIDDVCNIYRIKAAVSSCGMHELNFRNGWSCKLPDEPDWNPEDYPPCEDVTMLLTANSEQPFLDANFINPNLTPASICDTTTLELLVRNTDTGNAFDVNIEFTVPLAGAVFLPGSVEIAYPSGNAYVPALGDPVFIDHTIKGDLYRYAGFGLVNEYLDLTGLPGFNPIAPTDSNEMKIRFKIVHDCDFLVGSVAFHSFQGLSSCGDTSNFESGASLPIDIVGADDGGKSYSVVFSNPTIITPGDVSEFTIIVTNLTDIVSGPDEHIELVLPEGFVYIPGSTEGLIPAGWNPGDPEVLPLGGYDLFTWDMPAGLALGEQAILHFKLTSPVFSCDNGDIESLLSTSVQNILQCASSGIPCEVEVLTSEGGQNFFGIPLGYNPFSVLFGEVSSICAFGGETITIQGDVHNNGDLYEQNLELLYYFDENQNGIIDNGESVIFSSEISGPFNAGATIPFNDQFSLSAAEVCHLLLLIQTSGLTSECPAFPSQVPVPELDNAGPDQVFCAGTVTTLEAQLGTDDCSNQNQYEWSAIAPASINGLSDIHDPSPVLIFTHNAVIQDTLVYVLYTFRPGCITPVSDTVRIVRAVSPAINAGPVLHILPGSSVVLMPVVTGGQPPLTYAWSPANTLNAANILHPTATPVDDTDYTLTVTTASGCQSTATLSVVLDINITVTVEPDFVTICKEETVQFIAAGGDLFTWYALPGNPPGGGLNAYNIPNPVFSNGVAGNTYFYNVVVGNSLYPGVTDTALVTIVVAPDPVVTVVADPLSVSCGGGDVTLTASGATTYSWFDPVTMMSLGTGNQLIVAPVSQTTYGVAGFNTAGCADTAYITIDADLDNTPPVLENVPGDLTIQCEDPIPAIPDVMANDNCDGDVNIVLTESYLQTDACVFLILRTWVATDDAGNTAIATQTITRVDTEAPQISYTNPLLDGFEDGDTLVVSCLAGVILGPQDVTVTDNCDSDIDLHFVDIAVQNGDCTEDGFYLLMECAWIAEDDCGNTTTLTIFVKITDSTPPVFIDFPDDFTLAPGENIPVPEIPLVYDDCAGDINPVLTETFELQNCGGVVYRTWTATDDCGNSTANTQTVHVISNGNDVLPPVFTWQHPDFPGINSGDTISINCGLNLPEFTIDAVSVSDICDPNPEIEMDIDQAVVNCLTDGIVEFNTYTWTATDLSGNDAVFVVHVRISDELPPVFSNVPDDLTLSLNEPLPDPVTPDVTDVCDDTPSIIFDETTVPQGCGATVYRTWSATDDCGNAAVHTQTIYVLNNAGTDITAPVISWNHPDLPGISAGDTLTVNCAGTIPDIGLDAVLVTDFCDPDPAIEIISSETSGDCATDGYLLLTAFTWTATDQSGNTSTFTIYLEIIDDQAPVISNVPDDLTLAIDEPLPDPVNPEVTDACDDTPSVVFDETTAPEGCGATVYRTWTATDDCGNVAVHTQTIYVLNNAGTDITPPVISWNHPDLPGISAGDTITVNCDGTIPDISLDAVLVTDLCDPDPDIEITSEESAGDCETEGYLLLTAFTWTATDQSGNTSTFTVYLEIIDDQAPVISNVPDDLTLAIDEPLPDPVTPEVTDACDDTPAIVFDEATVQEGCGAIVYLTWTATDDCGNVAVHTQTIYVLNNAGTDIIAPVISWNHPDLPGISAGDTLTVNCGGTIPDIGLDAVLVTDFCDPDPGIEITSEETSGDCVTDGYLLLTAFTWTATDQSGNSSTFTVYLEIIDDQAPVISNVPDDLTLTVLDPLPDPATLLVTDACDDEPSITFEEETVSEACGSTVYRTWTATDNCGNTAVYTQTIQVICIDCQVDLISEDSLTVLQSNCDSLMPVCLSVDYQDFLDYDIYTNGLPYAGSIAICNIDTFYAYTYFPIPGQGINGPYHLIYWSVNGTEFSGDFEDIYALVDSMNTWDPEGNWTLNTQTLTIFGGYQTSVYGDIQVEHIETGAFALLDINSTQVPMGIELQFPTGSNEIIFLNTENGCTDTLIVNVNCDEIEEIEIFTTVWLHDTDTLCLVGLPINGNLVSIENLCPELSDDNVHFTFDEINGCVIYEGLTIGIDSACLIVCTDLEECISILFITEVIEPADPELLPIAVVDISTTLQNDPVEVVVLENDTINGTLVSLSIVQQPLNGTATVALDNSGIEYVPDPNYCDNDQPDEFIYLLCNENGCDTAVVFITVDCDGIQIFTGFSPNKDGVNDNFIITGLDEYPENILRVYNRWGNMVYYKENYRNQWQGTWEGKDVPDGTYFYILDTGRGQIYSGYLQIHR